MGRNNAYGHACGSINHREREREAEEDEREGLVILIMRVEEGGRNLGRDVLVETIVEFEESLLSQWMSERE